MGGKGLIKQGRVADTENTEDLIGDFQADLVEARSSFRGGRLDEQGPLVYTALICLEFVCLELEGPVKIDKKTVADGFLDVEIIDDARLDGFAVELALEELEAPELGLRKRRTPY